MQRDQGVTGAQPHRLHRELSTHYLGGGLGFGPAVLPHDDLTVEVVPDPVWDLRGILQAEEDRVVRRPPFTHDPLEGSSQSGAVPRAVVEQSVRLVYQLYQTWPRQRSGRGAGLAVAVPLAQEVGQKHRVRVVLD